MLISPASSSRSPSCQKQKKVSFCNSNAGCPEGPGKTIVPANTCVIKHVDDIYNPDDYGTGLPSHTWRSATIDKKICVSQFGRRLMST